VVLAAVRIGTAQGAARRPELPLLPTRLIA